MTRPSRMLVGAQVYEISSSAELTAHLKSNCSSSKDDLSREARKSRNFCKNIDAEGPKAAPFERSLIGMLMSSTSETDALAGVTVLFEVGSWSPHHGCQG